MKVGYARLWLNEPAPNAPEILKDLQERPDGQVRELQRFGCVKIFTDPVSDINPLRPALHQLLNVIVAGDTLVVWKLDSLGYSTRQLLELMERLSRQGVHFISLQDAIDTAAPEGKSIYQVFTALSELERSRVRQRTQPARLAARAQGCQGGRPKGLTPQYQRVAPAIRAHYESGQLSTTQIMQDFGIGSRRTRYKILRFSGVEIASFQRIPVLSPDSLAPAVDPSAP